MQSTLLPLLILLFSFELLHAQASLKGRVTDISNDPVLFANVLLLNPTDNSLIRGSVADEQGNFEITLVQPGTYLVRAVMTGFLDHTTSPIDVTQNNGTLPLPDIKLLEDAVQMEGVVVIAQKPLYEQRIDRMVVNVAASITSSGTNALQVLERSPGVIVNRQSNILTLSGKSGVVVMINGRINYMPAEAVVRMLEGMSSDNIEKIEIITVPPAGFDAEGNAGYINIVLKQNLDEGFNGSYGAGVGFGKGIQANANVNFNYRKGRMNLYGDYSYLKESQEQIFHFYRRIMLNADQIETDTRSLRDPDTDNHNARLGLDYQMNDKTVIGLLVSGYDTKWAMDAINTSLQTKNGIPDTNILVENYELNQWKHAGGNVNIQHTFSEGNKLTIDADVLWYKDNNPTDYENAYYDGSGQFLFSNSTRARKLTPIDIKVGKLDYTAALTSKIKMETGVKVTLSHFANDVGVDYLLGDQWVADHDLTALYNLDEEIFAGYVSLESPFGKGYNIKGGLRYEYTASNLGSVEQENIVDRKFGEIFPTLYLSKEFNTNNSINLSYSKRITRPTFNDMAPFVIFIDPYTFFSGNAALQPAIAHKFSAGYKWKTILLNLEYSKEDSSIARFQSTIIPGTNRQLLFAENLEGTDSYTMTLSIPVSPYKWWNMYYNVLAGYQEARKYFGNELTAFSAGGAGFFSTQTFILPANFTFELSGFYGTGGLFGIVKMDPVGAVNVGLQKKFGETGGTLRVGYDDVFHTLRFRGETDHTELNQYFSADLVFQVPTFKIGYSNNFGNQKMKGKRERETGAEEERRRIN